MAAERRAELTAFPQAGTGPAGVGDGYADGEQAGSDQGRGADLAGERDWSGWARRHLRTELFPGTS